MTDQADQADHPGHATAARESGEPGGRLTTRAAAERLGVKPATLYAYVSRGLLTSRRDPGGRGSTFDAAEVEALLRRNRRSADSGDGGDPSQRIRTGITLIDKDRYFFRGVDATELARHHSYETVADWLWTGTLRPGIRFTAPPRALAAARRAVAAMPGDSGSADLLRVAAVAAAVTDPVRFDLGQESVIGSARMLIPTLVDALPVRGEQPGTKGSGTKGSGADASGTGTSGTGTSGTGASGTGASGTGASDTEPIARRLWCRLTPADPDPAAVRVLDLTLALLVDHDLAASTLAARVAASARAHPYAVVSAGLGVLDGPLHGAAGSLAHRMLTEVLERGSAAAVVADHLRAGRPVPGLGHRLYPGRDPRAEAVFAALETVPAARAAMAAAREVEAATARQLDLNANVDLALGALTVAFGMAPEACETVFAVARTAGWIAHALEEYEEQPLRMRPSGRYTGPRPPLPLPVPVPVPEGQGPSSGSCPGGFRKGPGSVYRS
ncbi:citrate synthase [Streptomyces yaizuensis]|uniref:citrate synthase (unknown stereospecificity) n=1 Tax=Streptomyces yaizuensis TaxID=2989713 RepID=A0ABQ5PAP1_9ACTN|nr:citrate synthase [Streptomyces sp. YSPA8]GLF99654.1 citrate synthase [Streptomyces sp. YSPA8]